MDTAAAEVAVEVEPAAEVIGNINAFKSIVLGKTSFCEVFSYQDITHKFYNHPKFYLDLMFVFYTYTQSTDKNINL